MRLLLVSDLHYSLPKLDWLVAHAAEVDVVVIAGDCLDIGSAVPLPAQVAVIDRYLAHLAEVVPTVVRSGNHDLTGPDADGERAAGWLTTLETPSVVVDGQGLRVGDVGISVLGWWDGPVGRARLVERLTREAADRPPVWVWVYHWPPAGSPTCLTERGEYGDADVRGWIDEHRPDLVLTGHVHQAPFQAEGRWVDRVGATWVCNAGSQRAPVPSHVVVDLAEGRARFVSLMGVDEVDLAPQPAQ